ncbi:MAG: hypothetical protein ABW360_01595 [Phenylobacterium sp.]
MSDAPHISETRHGKLLAELAGLGMSLARELHQRAMAAESDAEAVKLAAAFHQISRSVRQSLALEARLGREQEAIDLHQAPLRAKERAARVARRHSQVFNAVERMIWTEYEHEDFADDLVADLREILQDESLDDGFLVEPLQDQIDRIRARLDLIGPAPEVAEAALDPPGGEAADPPLRRSSG